MKYFKANPKFHHWITDDKRFGLTFQRSDDAKSFHKGIKIAVADLIDGWYCHQIVFSGILIFTFILYCKFKIGLEKKREFCFSRNVQMYVLR